MPGSVGVARPQEFLDRRSDDLACMQPGGVDETSGHVGEREIPIDRPDRPRQMAKDQTQKGAPSPVFSLGSVAVGHDSQHRARAAKRRAPGNTVEESAFHAGLTPPGESLSLVWPAHLANACLTACTTDADCAGGDTCQAGICTNLAPNGTACTSNASCGSGHCTDGVCCGSTSCGSCNSCAVVGKQGTCAPLPSGAADPAGQCQAMPASSCGTTGLCDGKGACSTYPDGTACAAPACDGNSGKLMGAATCMKGSCKAGSMTSCGSYACDATAGACKTSCASDADCAKKKTCALPAGATVGTCM